MSTHRIVLFSDVHLCDNSEKRTALLVRFLDSVCTQATQVWCLGDLWETYLNNTLTPLPSAVESAFARLAAASIPVHFIAGNRDFLVQSYPFFSVHRQPHILDVGNYCVCLLHGDQLTVDKGYLLYRAIVHSVFTKALFWCLPIFLQKAIARKIRRISAATNPKKPREYFSPSVEKLDILHQQLGFTDVVFGHFHKAYTKPRHGFGIHALGEWDAQGSYLELTEHGFSLKSFL